MDTFAKKERWPVLYVVLCAGAWLLFVCVLILSGLTALLAVQQLLGGGTL